MTRGGDVLTVDRASGRRRYRNTCPHTGAALVPPGQSALSRDGLHLVCSVHGALFRIEDGVCIAGPCLGQALEAVED